MNEKVKRIEFDTINGIIEVERFDSGVWEYGYVHDYGEICAILNHHQEGVTGAMILNEENFNRVKEEYGIK